MCLSNRRNEGSMAGIEKGRRGERECRGVRSQK